MKIQINGISTDLLVQTVTIRKWDRLSDSTLFRCYHCGTVIARVNGEVTRIIADLIPDGSVSVIHQCYMCKENYVFQTIRGMSGITQLVLAPQPERVVSTFHCILCRTPLVQYNNELAFLLPELKKANYPTVFNCLRADCNHPYLLREVVSLEV